MFNIFIYILKTIKTTSEFGSAGINQTRNKIVGTNQKIEDTTIYYNVKNFGAMGDGISDDSPAIQALVDEILSKFPYSGTIYFPSGKYRIATPINTYGNKNLDLYAEPYKNEYWGMSGGPLSSIRIIGENQESTFLVADNLEGVLKPHSTDPSAYFDLYAEHIRFVGKDKKGTSVVLDNDNVYLLRAYFKNCSFTNFEVGYKYDRYSGTGKINGFARFVDCVFASNKNGLYIGSDNATVENCFIIRNDGYGMILGQTHNSIIKGGKLEYNGRSVEGEDAQLLVTTGAYAVTFDTVYFEPTYGTDNMAKNTGSPLIRFNRSEQSSVIREITFRGCYFTGLNATLMQMNYVNLFGLTIDGGIIRTIKVVDESKPIMDISANSTVKNIVITPQTQLETIYDIDGSTITDWIWTSDSINGDVDVTNGILSVENQTQGGWIAQFTGSVDSAGNALFGKSYNVTKTATGIYRIDLLKTNVGTTGGNANYMPVLVTVENSTDPILASVAHIDSNTFDIYLKKKSDNSAVDSNFSFMAMISSQ
jgi:hypothetical protein